MNHILHNESHLRHRESTERSVAKELVMIHVAVSLRKNAHESLNQNPWPGGNPTLINWQLTGAATPVAIGRQLRQNDPGIPSSP